HALDEVLVTDVGADPGRLAFAVIDEDHAAWRKSWVELLQPGVYGISQVDVDERNRHAFGDRAVLDLADVGLYDLDVVADVHRRECSAETRHGVVTEETVVARRQPEAVVSLELV